MVYDIEFENMYSFREKVVFSMEGTETNAKSQNYFLHRTIDGKDAESPDIAVKEDPSTGDLYWVLNGEWLTGDDGKRVRANGKDGKDGKDGEDGKDAIAPTVRINPDTYVWEISVDGGKTWASTGTPAVGKDGQDGNDGQDGQDGKNGKDGRDGNQFILKVSKEESNDGAFMVIETKSGTWSIPIYENK